jgi:hypothetical protein
MAKKSELKKQLEDILDQGINVDAVNLNHLFVRVASYNSSRLYHHTKRHSAASQEL